MELPSKPEHLHNLEFIRNLTPYIFSYLLIAGKPVLDVGCGFGYGASLLATRGAEQVVALDLEHRNVREVAQVYSNLNNLTELVMDAQRLGLKDKSFKDVTCFEVIEHVPKPDMLLSELRRVLKEDGLLLLTTPNRALRLRPLQRPWNPEHMREYTLKTLQKKLEEWFPAHRVLGLYGEPEPHELYKKMWQQSLFHAYFGWARSKMKILIPESVRKHISIHLSRSNASKSPSLKPSVLDMALPAPDPKHWPFYVSDLHEHCLNFFAICGFDDQIVQTAVRNIKQSACRCSQT